MPNYTQEELMKKYKNLPQDLQEAIFNVEIAESIRKIGEKYKLLLDKVGGLADETGLVMLGLTHPKEYISNLEKRLGVDRQTAKNIAEEVNKEIFFKIRESLRQIHGIHEEEKKKIQESTEAGIQEKEKLPEEKMPMSKAGIAEEIKPPIPEIRPTAPETPKAMPQEIQKGEEIPLTEPPIPEAPPAPQPKIPPIFAPKTENKVFSAPPKISEKNELLEELNKSLEEKKSIIQKIAEEKKYANQDPYKEPLQ